MEFKVLKANRGLVNKYSSVIFTIEDDGFYYRKNKNDEKFKRYHISYLNEVYIQRQIKDKPEYVLILEINGKYIPESNKEKKNKIIKLAEEKNNDVLSEIKKILNVKRLQYDMNLFLYNFKEKAKITLNKDKFEQLKDEKQTYNMKKSIMENVEKKIDKEKINDLLQDKLNNFIKALNQQNFNVDLLDEDTLKKIREIINGSFILDNDEINNDDNLKKFEYVDNYNKIYLNLIKLFTQLKFCYILKRFKYYDKKYLIENQKCNFLQNLNNNNILDSQENSINKNSNILFNPNEDTLDNLNEIKNDNDDIDLKISKKKEQNEHIQSRILAGLNSNTKMKESLKNLILAQNKKLYFCIKCNSLIEKSLLDKANCNFDKTCTNRSFFYCRKCKLHLCTKCIAYQRGMKCSKNHKYFQKPINTKEEIKCYICNKANIFPYYECKYCKEQICSKCAEGAAGRQNSCFNCNNELTWRKCIYSTCDRCHKLVECFYYCICCDYSICINCSNLPKNMCGGLHELEEIDLSKNYYHKDNSGENKVFKNIFCYNHEVSFGGKCSWCNTTIGKKKVFACLRCSLFLCEKCVKKNNE